MGYKLLLADDSITIQKVVSIIFANEECELTIVDNGNAALEKAGEVLPDIMLVDTLMPGTSGYEVCEKIRQNPALKQIPLLLLTGAFEPFDVDKAKESGADDFISKPFESQILVEKVKSLVEFGKGRMASGPPPEPAAAVVLESEPAAAVEEQAVWSIDAPAPASPAETSFSEEAVSLPEMSAAPVEENVWAIDASGAVPEPPAEEPAQGAEPAEWVTPAYEVEETAWTIGASAAELIPDVPVDEPALSNSVAEEDFPSIEEVVDPVTEEVVEVSPDDDLWGAFELEPLVDDGRHVDVVETYMITPDAASFDASSADSALGFPEITSGWEVAEEQTGSVAPEITVAGFEPTIGFAESSAFTDDSSVADISTVSDTSPALQDEAVTAAEVKEVEAGSPFAESFFFSEPQAPVVPAAEEILPEPPVPPMCEPVSTALLEAAAPERDTAPATSAGIAVTEEQLEAMVTRISREVIERIVWEVVPDLAEVLIKEEIRKIKEGR